MARYPYLLLIVSIFFVSSCGSDADLTKFKITGSVKNIDGTKVYLEQYGTVLDSTVVEGGAFSLSGKLLNNRVCEVFFKNNKPPKNASESVRSWGRPVSIFVEAGKDYELFAEDEQALLHVYHQLTTNSANAKLHDNFVRGVTKKHIDLRAQITNVAKEQSKLSLIKNAALYKQLDDSIDHMEARKSVLGIELIHDFVTKHANSYPGIYELSKAPDLGVNTQFYINIEKRLTKKFREHTYGQRFIKNLAKHRSDLPIQVKIEAITSSNKKFNYDDFKNDKLLIFDFWATWCAPCLQEMPSALKIENAFRNRGVSYVFISFDSRLKTWQRESKSLGLTHSYRVENQDKAYLLQTLHMNTIPRYVIADPKGNVLVKSAPSPSDPAFYKLVEKLLAKRTPEVKL